VAPTPVTISRDIEPLSREFDRNSTIKALDLWNGADGAAHQAPILLQFEGGTMPCDGAWPIAQVETLKRWIAEGSPAWDLTAKGKRFTTAGLWNR